MTTISNENEIRGALARHGVTPSGIEALMAKLAAHINRSGLRPDVRLVRCMPVELSGFYGPAHGATTEGWRVTDMYVADGGADQAVLGLVDKSIAPMAWRPL